MKLSFEQKKTYLNNHVTFEFAELFYSKFFFLWVFSKKDELMKMNSYDVFKNISIEHTHLHVRNLYEFYFDKMNEQHVTAIDYVKNWQIPTKTVNLKEYEKRVNHEIFHMGILRFTNPDEKSWDVVGLVDDMLNITRMFLKRLDGRYYGNGIKSLKEMDKKISTFFV